MPTSVSDVFTVKYCHKTESSNPCLGKASQYQGEFLWKRKSLFAKTNVVILNVNGFLPSAVLFRKHILPEEVSSSF